MNLRAGAYIFLAGVWFAELQASSLFHLHSFYTATIQAYILLVTAWLSGALLGVWITARVGPLLWIGSSISSAALLLFWNRQNDLPVELSWLLVFLTAIPAGQLFQEQLNAFSSTGKLFFLESLGFTVGLIMSATALMQNGLDFCRLVPFQGLALALFSYLLTRKEGPQ